MFNKWKLTRWARLIKLRDKGICFLCNEKPKIFTLHAHHIYPKANPVYMDRAYNLDNGISLCSRCHRQITHTTWTSWKKFCLMFRTYMRRKYIKNFNRKRQI